MKPLNRISFLILFPLMLCLFLIWIGSSSLNNSASASEQYPVGVLDLISSSSFGVQANRNSFCPQISANGQFIAFSSDADNLMPGVNYGIFVKNAWSGELKLVIASSSSYKTPLSADGRYIAFGSDASNLVAGDNNGVGDVFRKDLLTSDIIRVSTTSSGEQASAGSFNPSISDDGRFVAFNSNASTLVYGDYNERPDVFLKDTQTGTVSIINTGSGGEQTDHETFDYSLSGNGRYLVFTTSSDLIVPGDQNQCTNPIIQEEYNCPDVFVKDLLTGNTTLVSSDSAGFQGNQGSYRGEISYDGRYVVFGSDANNLVPDDTNTCFGYYGVTSCEDVFIKDTVTGSIDLVSTDSAGGQANADSFFSDMSDDGRFVFFSSEASNLVPNDTNGQRDVFVKDTLTGKTSRISTDSSGVQADDTSVSGCAMSSSGDGHFVTFESFASNLVDSDTNSEWDVFLAVNDIWDGPDSIPPTTSTDASDLWQNNDVTVVLDCSDGGSGCSSTYYRVANDDINTGNSISLTTDGIHNIVYRSVDAAGNIERFKSATIKIDKTNPQIDEVPQGDWTNSSMLTAFLSDFAPPYQFPFSPTSGVDAAAISVVIDDTHVVTDCHLSGTQHHEAELQCPMPDLEQGSHSVEIQIRDLAGNAGTASGTFNLDTIAPQISALLPSPGSSIDASNYSISATFSDNISGVDSRSTRLIVNGHDVTADASISESGLEYDGTGEGIEYAYLEIRDQAGNLDSRQWSFSLNQNYYFPWYDTKYGRTWLLTAMPQGTGSNSFDIYIRNSQINNMEKLTNNVPFTVSQGSTVPSFFNNRLDGPVKVKSYGGPGLVSERSLFGNSFEEVWATAFSELDSHYWWPYYDGDRAGGMTNWILVANPQENGEVVQVEVRVHAASSTGSDSVYNTILEPGQSVTPTFEGVKAGPVEVSAWRVGGSRYAPGDGRKVIASQRVLYNGAFNEFPGIGESKLDAVYLWTWYDNLSAGSANWICVANPGSQGVWAAILVGNPDSPSMVEFRYLAPFKSLAIEGPAMGGPVMAIGCADENCADLAPIVASQRVIWGSSFSEIAGTSTTDLDAHWTWYDNLSAGSRNWVLVANINSVPIHAEITVAGISRWTGWIYSMSNTTPIFPGVMGGPVTVRAWTTQDNTPGTEAPVFASQRVLWNGYFNEIVGKGIN